MFMPFLAQLDQAVEQRLPVAVAGEIVVGDEEALDALRDVLADDPLEIVGRAEPALAALHVDDGAERALIGTAAAEIDARQRTGRAAHVLARQDRRRLALQRRQVVHVVVERLRALPAQASRSTSSSRPSSASPAKNEMPSACASRISGGISGSIAMQPETWKPPMPTGSPAARNGRARSTARGNWLDCTPTSAISALPPAVSDRRG